MQGGSWFLGKRGMAISKFKHSACWAGRRESCCTDVLLDGLMLSLGFNMMELWGCYFLWGHTHKMAQWCPFWFPNKATKQWVSFKLGQKETRLTCVRDLEHSSASCLQPRLRRFDCRSLNVTCLTQETVSSCALQLSTFKASDRFVAVG